MQREVGTWVARWVFWIKILDWHSSEQSDPKTTAHSYWCAVALQLLEMAVFWYPTVCFVCFLLNVCVCVCAFLCMYLQEASKLNSVLCQTFVFCYLWALGGNLIDSHWDTFDTFVRQQFEDNSDAKVHFKYTEIHLRSFWLSMITFMDKFINKHTVIGTFSFFVIIYDNHINFIAFV